MSKYTGDLLAVDWNTTTITANFVQSCDINEQGEALESTGASDTYKTYLTGNTDATATLELWDDDVPANLFNLFPMHLEATLDVYPAGEIATKQKRSMTAFVVGRSRGVPHNGVVALSISLQIVGTITDTVVSA